MKITLRFWKKSRCPIFSHIFANFTPQLGGNVFKIKRELRNEKVCPKFSPLPAWHSQFQLKGIYTEKSTEKIQVLSELFEQIISFFGILTETTYYPSVDFVLSEISHKHHNYEKKWVVVLKWKNHFFIPDHYPLKCY